MFPCSIQACMPGEKGGPGSSGDSSFTELVSLWGWVETPTHLTHPPAPEEFLADRERRCSAEAIRELFHKAQGPQVHRSRDLPAGFALNGVQASQIVAPEGQGCPLPTSPAAPPPPLSPPLARDAAAGSARNRRSSSDGSSTRKSTRQRSRMEEALGSQIATSAVPGSMGFNRVPPGTQGGGGEVTWDEMGQLGLHKALNEYYKLSASQRNLRLCGRGGPPSLLCKLAHRVLVPQLPAALAPPALLSAAGSLLYAAAWLLYNTAALTIPLALWLAFAADGRLSLAPHAAGSVSKVHPAAGAALERLAGVGLPLPLPLPPAAEQPAAALLLLGALLLLLRVCEAAVLRRRQQRWEAAQRCVTAADVQARYAGWSLPGAAGSLPDPAAAAAAAAAAAQQQEQRARAQGVPQQQQQAPPLLQVLQGEVQHLWHNVMGGQLPASELQTYEDVAAAIQRLSQETGVELRMSAAGAGTGGSSSATDPGRQLLDALLQIKHAVGLA